MAVAYGSIATTTDTGFPSSKALTMPSGVTAGDLLVACVTAANTGITITMTGWTALFTTLSGSFESFRIFTKVAAGSDTGTASFSGSVSMSAVVARFTGVDGSTPVEVSATSGPTTGGTPS